MYEKGTDFLQKSFVDIFHHIMLNTFVFISAVLLCLRGNHGNHCISACQASSHHSEFAFPFSPSAAFVAISVVNFNHLIYE